MLHRSVSARVTSDYENARSNDDPLTKRVGKFSDVPNVLLNFGWIYYCIFARVRYLQMCNQLFRARNALSDISGISL